MYWATLSYIINAHLGITWYWFAYEINIFQLSEEKMEINAGNSKYLNLCHALQHNLYHTQQLMLTNKSISFMYYYDTGE